MRSRSPGTTGFRNFRFKPMAKSCWSAVGPSTPGAASPVPFGAAGRPTNAEVCISASAMSAPGRTERCGKCPWKQGSLAVTFLIPIA